MDDKLKKIIDNSENIVFFGGAGVSTESGIPDFRSVDGLYSQKYDYPPEMILSHSFFVRYTDEFYRFYREKMIFQDVLPNKAHYALSELEKIGKLKAVITQNIDGLHQAAGSVNVIELHGSVHRNYCMKCKKHYPLNAVTEANGVPLCVCGGIIKPDVVLYEEQLNTENLQLSEQFIKKADTLIIGGTSLAVYPASGLVDFFNGKNLVLINRQETHMDSRADAVFRGNIGEVLGL